ncbi:non-ribosomal peptide synthetase [Kribbella sp. WER1]
MTDPWEQIEALSPGQREKFDALLMQETHDGLVRVDRGGILPLSFAQQRLWFLYQLVPLNSFYNVPVGCRLTGGLDVVALEKALGEVVERHEVLRTRIEMQGGEPCQVVVPFGGFELGVSDLSGEDDVEEAARRVAAEEAGVAFDLSLGVLLRARLLRLGLDDHVLLVTMHHIASDGWSLGVFWRELSALYGAFSQGGGSPLVPLPVQYADFSVWQRGWLEGEVLESQLAYWRDCLVGMPPALELPVDRPRPAMLRYEGGSVPVRVPQGVYERLVGVGREENSTLFMTMLAAFQLLLSRYSGREDVVVGSPIANRTRPELEKLIGFFVNTLVLRTDVSGDPTFRELVGRVREVCLGAYGHQDLPFEYLVEKLDPARDLSRNPLVQVVFQILNTPRGDVQLGDLAVQPFGDDEVRQSKFDLEFHLLEVDGGVVGQLVYSSELFDRDTVERFADHYLRLLEAVVEAPDLPVSEHASLTRDERRRVLVEWNDTGGVVPEVTVCGLFEAQVVRSPEAVAVVCGGDRLTYAELNARANRVARRLVECGVGPEVLVGLCVERSVEMVVGVLAVLKADGAYVPLDPQYPAARLEFMLADTAVPVVLTRAGLVDALPDHHAMTVLLDDPAADPVGEEADEQTVTLGRRSGPENLAYVIYTPGSTGQLMGVMVQHRGLADFAVQHISDFGVVPGESVIQFPSLAFDASVPDLFVALCSGACLRVVAASEDVGALGVVDSADVGPETIGIAPVRRTGLV